MTASDAWTRDYWAKGFRFFSAGVDVHLVQAALRGHFKVLNDLKDAL